MHSLPLIPVCPSIKRRQSQFRSATLPRASLHLPSNYERVAGAASAPGPPVYHSKCLCLCPLNRGPPASGYSPVVPWPRAEMPWPLGLIPPQRHRSYFAVPATVAFGFRSIRIPDINPCNSHHHVLASCHSFAAATPGRGSLPSIFSQSVCVAG